MAGRCEALNLNRVSEPPCQSLVQLQSTGPGILFSGSSCVPSFSNGMNPLIRPVTEVGAAMSFWSTSFGTIPVVMTETNPSNPPTMMNLQVTARIESDFDGMIRQGECRNVVVSTRGVDGMPATPVSSVTLNFNSLIAALRAGSEPESVLASTEDGAGMPGTDGGIQFFLGAGCLSAPITSVNLSYPDTLVLISVKGIDQGNFTWSVAGNQLVTLMGAGTVDGGCAGSGQNCNTLPCCSGTCGGNLCP